MSHGSNLEAEQPAGGAGVQAKTSSGGMCLIFLHYLTYSIIYSFIYFCLFFWRAIECDDGHSFASVANIVFLRDVWIRTQRAAVASRRATNLATHLPQYTVAKIQLGTVKSHYFLLLRLLRHLTEP